MTKHILIIDDEIDIGIGLKAQFEFEGFEGEIDLASTAQEAFQRLSKQSYQALIIDIKLSGSISGIDIIKECKKHKERPKIIVLSATPRMGLIPVFKEEGISDDVNSIFEKPVSDRDLNDLIQLIK